jgi:hypothetical protein
VPLNEVHGPSSSFEVLVGDCDCLQRHASLGLEEVGAAFEKLAVVVGSDGFDHFHRDQLVIGAFESTIVLEEQRNAILQAGFANALLCQHMLFFGDGGGRYAATVLAGGVQGEGTPTRTDFEQMVTRLQVEFATESIDLGDRGLFQRGLGMFVDAAGVSHRGV